MDNAKANGRNGNGQFAAGNAGGPGRPRRAVEREYLRTVADAVPLDTWREIVETAVQLAKRGESKARDWLAKHLIGDPIPLSRLAADDAAGMDPVLDMLVGRLQARDIDNMLNEGTRKEARAILDAAETS